MVNNIKKTVTRGKTIILSTLFSVTTFSAEGASTSLGRGLVNGAKKAISEIEAIYCGSLFFLLLAINVVWLAVTKNEKTMGILKKTLIGLVAAYFVLKLLNGGAAGNAIGNTADEISNWLK